MQKARVLVIAALVLVGACGGGGDDGGGGTGPSVFTTLTVQPLNVGLLVNGTQPLTATARDQKSVAMSGLTATYTTGNASIATVTTAGLVTGVAVGTTQITVTGTVGTVTKTAQVNVVVLVPSATASVAATIDNQFTPSTAFVTVGGTVTWTFATTHNVIFDAGGPTNIGDTSSGSVSRAFPNAGTFNYHCTIHSGMNGSVEVK